MKQDKAGNLTVVDADDGLRSGSQSACSVQTDILPDLLRPGLRVVFCGTAAGKASATAGAYYAGRGNRFWPTLHAIGLTPVLLQPWEFPKLLDLDIGLTDLSKTSSGADAELPRGCFNVARFSAAIAAAAPGILAFNGIRAASEFLGEKVRPLPYGVAHLPPLSGMPPIAVLPSTAGMAARYWSIGPWQELANYLTRSASG